jgi:hypothetical protein
MIDLARLALAFETSEAVSSALGFESRGLQRQVNQGKQS